MDCSREKLLIFAEELTKMGKKSQKCPRSCSSTIDAFSTSEDCEMKWNEMLPISDLSVGRRVSGGEYTSDEDLLIKGFKNDSVKYSSKGACAGKRPMGGGLLRNMKSIIFTFLLMGLFFLLDSLFFSGFDTAFIKNNSTAPIADSPKGGANAIDGKEKTPVLYSRLLHMASLSLAERDQKESKFWKESYSQASIWKPCALTKARRAGRANDRMRFILVSANGGLNQQRVAVCNAVAVASLLNATLVIPKFLYSNVWKDPSQFSDIYQEDTFINTLKNDVNIVKELPSHLKSLDLEAIGSQITDADLSKEATPDEYMRNILPILSRNGIVHFLGYGNRLGFDPMPPELQKLRCKCNFHALKFSPQIQKAGSLLVNRIRKHSTKRSMLHKQLLGSYIYNNNTLLNHNEAASASPSKYLALHLRFEIDMVAYSMCDFGGGDSERTELQAYRAEHFPLLLQRLKHMKPLFSPTDLRRMGRCPLTPEEAVLVLAALGFDSKTYIYLAGSRIYGGQSRMHPLISLYPNLVTKEDLLSPNELAPFRNFSSQFAAMDFIACAASDVFAITDSGSQLSSLVSGFRTYYGRGNAPTLRPSKRRLAAILQENSTIRWHTFEDRIRKMIDEGQRVLIRSTGRSIYRQPRCRECMCKDQ